MLVPSVEHNMLLKKGEIHNFYKLFIGGQQATFVSSFRIFISQLLLFMLLFYNDDVCVLGKILSLPILKC
jgi:hypothetical protein